MSAVREETVTIPCGKAETRTYVDERGNVLRRDVTIKVERALLAIGKVGIFHSLRRIVRAGVEAGRKSWNER